MYENNVNVYDYNLEDELYMQRRHAIAMEGLADEIYFDENEINHENEDMFEEIIQNERVFPDLIIIGDNGMNNDYIPLERQNGVDIEQDEYELQEYGRARVNNCAWEDIRSNSRWTEGQLARVDWSFPSNMMKEVEIKFVVLTYEIKENINNNDELTISHKNRVEAMFDVCKSCNCCERHKKDFPEYGEIWEFKERANVVELEDVAFGEQGKENNCICACRHIARRISYLL